MATPLASPVYTIGNWVGNATDDYGTDWVVESEDGWSASPPVRTVMEDKSAGDGSWSGPGYWGARVITLSGKALTTDRLSMLAAKERLKAAAAPATRTLTTLQVDEAHLSRIAKVRLSDQLAITDWGEHAFNWSMILVAPDPRRYDAVSTFASTELPPSFSGIGFPVTFPHDFGTMTGTGTGSVYFNQAGDYDQTPALLTITGPIDNPSATHLQTGRSLTFDLSLLSGETLVIDLDSQTALLNGTSSRVYALSPSSAWFQLVPGVNEIQFRGQDPGTDAPPTLTLTASSAWT